MLVHLVSGFRVHLSSKGPYLVLPKHDHGRRHPNCAFPNSNLAPAPALPGMLLPRPYLGATTTWTTCCCSQDRCNEASRPAAEQSGSEGARLGGEGRGDSGTTSSSGPKGSAGTGKGDSGTKKSLTGTGLAGSTKWRLWRPSAGSLHGGDVPWVHGPMMKAERVSSPSPCWSGSLRNSKMLRSEQ